MPAAPWPGDAPAHGCTDYERYCPPSLRGTSNGPWKRNTRSQLYHPLLHAAIVTLHRAGAQKKAPSAAHQLVVRERVQDDDVGHRMLLKKFAGSPQDDARSPEKDMASLGCRMHLLLNMRCRSPPGALA